MKKLVILLLSAALAGLGAAQADPAAYKVDKSHTFINFKVSHIGFAWIPGSFRDFDGTLSFDAENPANSKASFTVRIASLDTSHAERDKHLKSEDFFNAAKFPTAEFASTRYEVTGENSGILHGNLTIKGITKPVEIAVKKLAARQDPWGNYRVGFEGSATIRLADFGLNHLGEIPAEAELDIALEALRQ